MLSESESVTVDEDWSSRWRSAALALPLLHRNLERDADPMLLRDLIEPLPLPEANWLKPLSTEDARIVALDVLMVEAFVRRHASTLPMTGALSDRIAASAQAVADRLAMKPIISYPLYIRHNLMPPRTTRRFTDLDAELRFIRMHRFIEDCFDEVIATLHGVVDAEDIATAFATSVHSLALAFKRVNRVMAGFRDPVRMPRDTFMDGFRPYFAAVYGPAGPASGHVLRDGPSGLQSPTFRVLTTLAGYEDEVLDGWTRRIGTYHEPEERQRLENAIAMRGAGRALRTAIDGLIGAAQDLPHMHPAYGAHIDVLYDLAVAGGWLGPDTRAFVEDRGLHLDAWPGAVDLGELPSLVMSVSRALERCRADEAAMQALVPYFELEAMLFGFHLEHVAVAMNHIGHDRGTGGTTGVEFLQMALFRRAFPALWIHENLAEAVLRTVRS